MMTADHPLALLHTELGIPTDYSARYGLHLQEEARLLVPLGLDSLGRDQFAEPATAAAWRTMQAAALTDGIVLQLVSAFRSVAYQAGLIRRKLDQGLAMEAILAVSAAPGYSEHHTGRALDITAPGEAVLEETFELSAAYTWLINHAHEHGFAMSYPRDNPAGIAYEPWHWCYHASANTRI